MACASSSNFAATIAEIVLNQLFKQTQMEVTFGVINIALVNNEPKVLTLKELLWHYLTYRKEVVTLRTKFDLAEARKRETSSSA